ncbi:hypothetical protein ACFVTC_33905 [Streptomyces sp. NPDC057950]|uniref:hypothetical protein n=1 Tax=Streptomyces sp. NPDC057950 TaxID=3346288 RepID=UPI0036F01070
MPKTTLPPGSPDPDLAALCGELPALRRHLQGTELGSVLEEGLAVVCAGGSAADVLVRLGIAPTGRDRHAWGGPVTVAGLGSGHSHGERYGCPADRCGRQETREPGGPRPGCALLGSTMRLLED